MAKQLPAVAHDTDLEGYSYITQEKRSKDQCGQYAYGVRKKRKVVMAWVEKMVVMEESRTLNARVEQMSCESGTDAMGVEENRCPGSKREEMPWEWERCHGSGRDVMRVKQKKL